MSTLRRVIPVVAALLMVPAVTSEEKAVGLLSKASQKPAENGTRMALAVTPAT